jgi:hypothetical protein
LTNFESLLCSFCGSEGEQTGACHFAAQSEDGRNSVSWVPVCDAHAEGWNDDRDWDAPIYRIEKDVLWIDGKWRVSLAKFPSSCKDDPVDRQPAEIRRADASSIVAATPSFTVSANLSARAATQCPALALLTTRGTTSGRLRCSTSGQNQTEESEPSSDVARVFAGPAGSKRLILSTRLSAAKNEPSVNEALSA